MSDRTAEDVLHDSLQEWNSDEFCELGWNRTAAQRAMADLAKAGYAVIPAQSVNEPVAWRMRMRGASRWDYVADKPDGPSIHLFDVEPLYASPVPPQESVSALAAEWDQVAIAFRKMAAKDKSIDAASTIASAQAYEHCAKYLREALEKHSQEEKA